MLPQNARKTFDSTLKIERRSHMELDNLKKSQIEKAQLFDGTPRSLALWLKSGKPQGACFRRKTDGEIVRDRSHESSDWKTDLDIKRRRLRLIGAL
jgi:hypothetical protein